MSQLKCYLLGSPRFERNGQPLALKSSKAVALLAYLGIGNSPQPREQLIALLWPDSLPDAARKNLRNTLWALRKTLGDDLLHTDADQMSLAGHVWLDVRRFETDAESPAALQAALELYRGPLLNGLALADAPDFELWLAAERERLGQHYLRLLETQIAAFRRSGDWQAVIAAAHRALAADNLQEPIYRVLMEAHARRDERADALRHYQILRTVLARELGVEPLPETEQLRQQILAGHFQRGSAPNGSSSPAAPETPEPPPRFAPRAAVPFVGRRAELAALDEEFGQAQLGQTRIVLISGELGIGKSRLWQTWSAQLPAQITVLAARCLNTTQSLPFAPLTGLFGQSECLSGLIHPNSPVPRLWLAELSRLLPQIRQHVPGLPPPPAFPPEEEQRRLFEAFTQIVIALDSRPVVLFVDDLHWADQATLDWLVYLADRLQNWPLLLVAAYRPGDASAELSRAAAAWNRAGLVRRLPLARFNADESAQLLAALELSAEQTPLLQEKSAGNPYFLIELSRSPNSDAPPGLADLVRARLARLPDAARQVLQAAAVLSVSPDFATLRRTSGRGEEETISALETLLAENLLEENDSGISFTHPFVAQLVRRDLSLARRSFLHRRAAQALEATHADRLNNIAGTLASHYAQAGRPENAARYAEMAGREALQLGALAEAETFFRQSLQLEPTPARRLELGRVLNVRGELTAARAEMSAAAQQFEQTGDCAGLAQAYLAQSMSFMSSGQGREVFDWAKRALDALGDAPNPQIRAGAHHLLAAGGLLAGRPPAEAETHLLESIRLATENHLPEQAAIGRFELGNLLAQRGNLPAAIESFQASLNFAREYSLIFQQLLAHNNLAYHLTLTGQLDAAREHIEAALAMAEQHALFASGQYLYSTRGEIALAEGDLDGAEQWFVRALAEANRNRNQLQAANIRANLGLTAQNRGDLDEALLLLDEARRAISGLAAPYLQSQIDLWLTELYRQRGEKSAARAALERAQQRLSGSEFERLKAWAASLA